MSLILLLSTSQARYGLDAREILDVVPMVQLRKLPHAPEYVAGLFSYHGVAVPVVDLCGLTGDAPCRRRMSSRIILLRYPDSSGTARILGLLAERVTATAHVNEADLNSPNIRVEDAPYLDRIFSGEEGIVQCLRVDRLLPEALRRSLFPESAG